MIIVSVQKVLQLKATTDLRRITLPKSLRRSTEVNVYRLRLGYKCTWQTVENIIKECTFCQVASPHPLLHYILECDSFSEIRRKTGAPATSSEDPNALQESPFASKSEYHVHSEENLTPPAGHKWKVRSPSRVNIQQTKNKLNIRYTNENKRDIV
ncbi:hypothetical protein SK128_013964, partial [Halocaridina rubra]